MTENPKAFDHRPDPVLGAALRAALEPGPQAAFLARVRAGLSAARPGSWDVLAGWAPSGLAAAVAAALIAGFALGRTLAPPVAVDEASVMSAEGATPTTTALISATRPPDASIIFASRP
ncbi:MAG TPA: hypothetical protein VI139_05110 [Gemmatimonadales bacterium]